MTGFLKTKPQGWIWREKHMFKHKGEKVKRQMSKSKITIFRKYSGAHSLGIWKAVNKEELYLYRNTKAKFRNRLLWTSSTYSMLDAPSCRFGSCHLPSSYCQSLAMPGYLSQQSKDGEKVPNLNSSSTQRCASDPCLGFLLVSKINLFNFVK